MKNFVLRHACSIGVLAIVAATSACNDTTRPNPSADEAKANVVIVDDSTVATTTTSPDFRTVSMRFAFTVSITNTGTVPFLFEPCASTVEQAINANWKTAWAPVCALGVSGPSGAVLPGQSVTRTIDVTAGLSGPLAPTWDGAAAPGVIRFVAGLVPVGYTGTIPRVVSNGTRLVPAR
jgi:hypothetical protein